MKDRKIQAKHIIALIRNEIAKKSQITTQLSETNEKHCKSLETPEYEENNVKQHWK